MTQVLGDFLNPRWMILLHAQMGTSVFQSVKNIRLIEASRLTPKDIEKLRYIMLNWLLHITMIRPFNMWWTCTDYIYLLRKVGKSFGKGILYLITSVVYWHQYFLEDPRFSLYFQGFIERIIHFYWSYQTFIWSVSYRIRNIIHYGTCIH